MIWLRLFWVAVATDLLAIYLQWDTVRLISKPLIVLSLLIYFIKQAGTSSPTSLFMIMALALSIAGDVALLFEFGNPMFFMIGLASFLLAHIFYIAAFNHLRKRDGTRSLRWMWILGVVLYLGFFLTVLMPYAGDFRIPVIIYAVVLCCMLLMVVHAFGALYAKPGIICLAGALLFVVSDTTLALNKFYFFGFTLSGIMIMFTLPAPNTFW
jgi:uncharacterized membrane protein YhhN